MTKRVTMQIRVTEVEKSLLESMAEKAQLTMSELIREKLFGKKVAVRYTVENGKKKVVEV